METGGYGVYKIVYTSGSFPSNPSSESIAVAVVENDDLGNPILLDKPFHATMSSFGRVEFRLFHESDSIGELTDLLHRAYKPLADAGMRYWATHHTEEDTKKRIAGGRCYVAILEDKIIGTVTLKHPVVFEGRERSHWYSRPDVAHFGQFGVEPTLQKQGIGSRLLAFLEGEARASGATELAFDTSEHADHLIDFYSKRGFRFVEEIDYRPAVNYKSVIMSKPL